MTMNAAVVRSFDNPPVYEAFPEPTPSNEHEVLVNVSAAGLHPRVRSQSNGSHYTATGQLPLVPGVDGVGRGDDGVLVYFALDDTTMGSMADRTVIDTRRSIRLPEGADPSRIAAGMNPGMSSWIALTRRVEFETGQSVLILGATGNAGRMAVQVAKHLGASKVFGAGRDQQRLGQLPALGADAVVSLVGEPDVVTENLGKVAAEVDVVIDYIWGPPALETMIAIIKARSDRSRRLSWVQIGAQAGPTIELPSAVLRQANLCVMGSGQGSIGVAGMLEELPALAARISDGSIAVEVQDVPLAQVGDVWEQPASEGKRIVFVP
jgi:NADPH:quinone reductase-like Zn-dependent oxidoreductase